MLSSWGFVSSLITSNIKAMQRQQRAFSRFSITLRDTATNEANEDPPAAPAAAHAAANPAAAAAAASAATGSGSAAAAAPSAAATSTQQKPSGTVESYPRV